MAFLVINICPLKTHLKEKKVYGWTLSNNNKKIQNLSYNFKWSKNYQSNRDNANVYDFIVWRLKFTNSLKKITNLDKNQEVYLWLKTDKWQKDSNN